MKKASLAAGIAIPVFLGVLWMIGCRESPSTKVIKIGVVLPLSGDIAPYGQSSKSGMEVALEEVSGNQFIKGARVQALYEDEKGASRDAVNAIKKLIDIDRVPVVLGGIASSTAMAMAPLAEQSKTVLMCPFASSPKITTAGDFIFRVMPSDAYQGSLLPQWLEEKGIDTIAIVFVNNDWGKSLKDAFVQSFTARGGKILLEESLPEGTRDVKNIVAKLRLLQSKIKGLFLPTYPEEGGLLLKQIKEAGIMTPVYSGDTWANELLVKIAGASAEGSRFLAPIQYEGPEYQAFRTRYMSKFGKEPDLPAAGGYDAMKIVLACVKKLAEKGSALSGESLKAELYGVKDFGGATGMTTFDANGDVVSKEFARRIILGGKIIVDRSIE